MGANARARAFQSRACCLMLMLVLVRFNQGLVVSCRARFSVRGAGKRCVHGQRAASPLRVPGIRRINVQVVIINAPRVKLESWSQPIPLHFLQDHTHAVQGEPELSNPKIAKLPKS